MAEKKTGRPRGRPKASEKAVGPGEHAEMASMFLRGKSVRQIAGALNLSRGTVQHHLENHVKPAWRVGMQRMAFYEIAKIDELERYAWEMLERSERPIIKNRLKNPGSAETERTIETTGREADEKWARLIAWCISERCKIAGHYAAHRIKVDVGGELRVANRSREDVSEELMMRVAEKVSDVMHRRAIIQREIEGKN